MIGISSYNPLRSFASPALISFRYFLAPSTFLLHRRAFSMQVEDMHAALLANTNYRCMPEVVFYYIHCVILNCCNKFQPLTVAGLFLVMPDYTLKVNIPCIC